MRSGTCAAQQTLTAEAASVLKHSLSLAGRRGHAQVTPLHVAATLLTSRASLLRRACLKSQPHQPAHPLQCRALELCFNVALNRLPTTPGSTALIHTHQPSLSNALIAALKRAQAHQRRGCIEQQQQQPLLTIKVELEQLIISILDDPSVSRVMREAGFSSTAIKNNIEDCSSASVFHCYSTNTGGVFSSPCSPSHPNNSTNFWHTHFLSFPSDQNPVFFSPQKKIPTANSSKEDVKFVFDILLGRKRKNIVIVGDSISATEGLVSEMTRKMKMGEVPEELKTDKFLEFQLAPSVSSLSLMKREDVEMKVSELKKKVDYSLASSSGNGGVIIYIGDLKWIVETNVNCERDQVDRLVGDIEKLVCDYNSNINCGSQTKVWLMAAASYQVYMRCQMRQPPLETQWALQAVPVPSAGLGLTLHASSVYDSRLSFFSQNPSQAVETKPFIAKEEQEKLTCCAECTSNYENEVQHLKSVQSKQVPSWLQQYGNQSHSKDELVELRRKWNRFCHSLHKDATVQPLMGKSFSYASSYPRWPKLQESNSISFADHQTPNPLQSSNLVPRFRRQQSCTTIEFDFGNATKKHQDEEPSLNSLKHLEGKEIKITLALGNSVFSDSAESTEREGERKSQRGEISKLLRENVPWQSESIPSIAEALVAAKKDCWILIQGNDFIGKRKMALGIAESVFGSADFLFHLDIKSEEMGISRSEILERALKSNRKLVVLVEDVDLADAQFVKFLVDGFESGKWGELKEGSIDQIIFIFTKDDSSDWKKNRASSVVEMTLKANVGCKALNLDHKRKADWDFPNKSKNQRINEKENASYLANTENKNTKKDFSRQSSFNTLDLNLKADDEDDEKPGQVSPISSDLTRETTVYDRHTPNGLLDSIENRFIFNRKPDQDREMTEYFTSRIRRAFEEVCKKGNLDSFSLEEGVLDGILDGFGSFSNSLFDKWLKDIFQTSLEAGRFGGKEGTDVRLCLERHQKHILEDGYMGSCLPKKIKASSMD